ncbi:RNA polymerase sigma factor [Porphyrobacter sp. YT40]|uniref:RNA polymerase sigma factor n=1 Tax=Porphyrobacter sp. YT40 TaxID=2547601 RepID=UPI001143F7CB|nr:RNA polymerase sigma factor [Porphyrobacter sp. YT40]QDH33829.1 RNA polymerase sigma factor [Porphyrobacter sp. YT40]
MTERRSAGEALRAPSHSSKASPTLCLCSGYRARLDSLYRSEAEALRAWLARQVGHVSADDLVHEVFLRAARCPQLGELRNPRGFLRRIARNLIIDRVRRLPRANAIVPLLETIDTAAAPQQEAGLHARETLAAYEDSLALLPARTARIFAMSRVERKTYRQISEELTVTPATVEYHMMRALRCVRLRLAEARGERLGTKQI